MLSPFFRQHSCRRNENRATDFGKMRWAKKKARRRGGRSAWRAGAGRKMLLTLYCLHILLAEMLYLGFKSFNSCFGSMKIRTREPGKPEYYKPCKDQKKNEHFELETVHILRTFLSPIQPFGKPDFSLGNLLEKIPMLFPDQIKYRVDIHTVPPL
jgi:hypothetical protein